LGGKKAVVNWKLRKKGGERSGVEEIRRIKAR